MNKPKLSVAIITYNHELFIRKAMESILMQKVDFDFQIIISDDGSTDRTPDIIKEIAEQYPERFKLIFHPVNLGPRGNSCSAISNCDGEYLACLEGDDYWTDELKLQKQMDFMESHQDYAGCYHQCCVVDENNTVTKERLDWFCKDAEYTAWHTENFILPGQTGTMFMRNYYQKRPELLKVIEVETKCPLDRITPVILLSQGRIACMEQNMSAYRYIVKKGASNYTSRNAKKLTYGYSYFYEMTSSQERVAKNLDFSLDFFDLRWRFIKEAATNAFKEQHPSYLGMSISMLMKISKRTFLKRAIGKIKKKLSLMDKENKNGGH